MAPGVGGGGAGGGSPSVDWKRPPQLVAASLELLDREGAGTERLLELGQGGQHIGVVGRLRRGLRGGRFFALLLGPSLSPLDLGLLLGLLVAVALQLPECCPSPGHG